MSNQKIIIQKLLKIAKNQQKVLAKLAQFATDPNVEYLTRAAQVAAANCSFVAKDIQVVHVPNSNGTTVESTSLNIEGGYSVSLDGAPKDNRVRQKFIDTLKSQVRSQKPELETNLSITFRN